MTDIWKSLIFYLFFHLNFQFRERRNRKRRKRKIKEENRKIGMQGGREVMGEEGKERGKEGWMEKEMGDGGRGYEEIKE